MSARSQPSADNRLLLVHPQPSRRVRIAEALAAVPGLRLVEADDLAGAKAVAAAPLAIIVLALDLPDARGLAVLDGMREVQPLAPIAVIVDDAADGRLAVRQGAHGFVAQAGLSPSDLARQVCDVVLELRARTLEQQLAERIGDRLQRSPSPPGSPGAIAHDFNNLLQVIMNAAEELCEAGLPAPFATNAELILATARRGIALSRQLHAAARGHATDPERTPDETAR